MTRFPPPRDDGDWDWGFGVAIVVVVLIAALGIGGYIELNGQDECEAQGGVLVDIPQNGRHCLIGESK